MSGDLKAAWRARLRPAEGTQVAGAVSSGICGLIADHLARTVDEGKWVVVYDALPEEVDLGGVAARHATPETRFAVTRTPDLGYELSVHPLGSPLERHRYGYMQPRSDAVRIDDADIGAVLVPAMGFDCLGNRLGRGKGYYDRFLHRLLRVGVPGLQFLGIAGTAIAEELPIDDHDVAMTHVVLSTGVWPVPVPPEALDGVTHLR